MSEQGLTRRHVFGATAALAAAAALAGRKPHGPPPGPGAAEAAAAGVAKQVGASNSGRAWAGATISAAAMGTSDWLEAARRFDAKIGRPMAVNAARMYFKDSTIGVGIGLVRKLAAEGVTAVLSFQPSRSLHPSERAKLQANIRQCRQAGLDIEAVALWNEPNDIMLDPNPFRSAAEYIRYVRYYGPAVVAEGVPLAYIPLVLTNTGTDVIGYFPGSTLNGRPLVTKVFADYYCHAQFINGVRLDSVLALSKRHGLRLGLGEFGMTNGSQRPNDGQFTSYMNYLTQVFSRHPNPASCMYFANGHGNVPTAAGYAALRRFYDAVGTTFHTPRSAHFKLAH